MSAPDAAQEEKKPPLNLDVTVTERGACERHVTVTVPRGDIDRYIEEAFDELGPKAEVPGFRPGRAPRKLIKSRFREQISNQVKGSLLMDAMTQVNETHEFSAISEPDFDVDAVVLPEEGPLTFEFNLEVRPEFDIPEWKGLQLEQPVHEYSDAEVDDQLKQLLARYGDLAPIDGSVEAEDFVTLNVTFRNGEETLSKLEEESVRVLPVLSFPDGKLEGFDKLMIGASEGDKKQAKITLSSELEDEELAGKEVDVEFEVLDVKRLELPELDQAFLDRIGGFEDQEDLRGEVRKEVERQFQYRQQQRVRQQITAQLTAGADWELPPDLLRRQSARELQRAVMELKASGFDEQVIRAHSHQIQQNSLGSTKTALKEHFILERIAEEEKFDAEPDDYDAEIALIGLQSNESPRRVRARLEKRGEMDSLRNQIIERKVIELIMSHAGITEVPYEPPRHETAAVDHAICPPDTGGEIPEAKHGGDAEPLRQPADRS